MTYGQLDAQSSDLAKRFAAKIKKGDKVFLCLADPVQQMVHFFAIIKAGGICVFANENMTEKTCQSIIEENNIQYKIDASFAASFGESTLPELHDEDVFLGGLTSGSTGTPKVVLRDHRSWLVSFSLQSELFNISGDDVLYLVGSFAYTANLNACVHIFFEGGTVVLSRSKLSRVWAKEILSNSVNAIFMVPAHYRILTKAVIANSKVTSIVTGGAKIDKNTVEDLAKLFPNAVITEYYGASELGYVSYAQKEDLLARPESVGKLFPGVLVEIISGIIWIASPYIISSMQPKASIGDIGILDEEGYLTLLGREKGIINVAGIKVFPGKVEQVVRACPGVGEAAVFGISDTIRGEKVCAAVVKSAQALSAKDVLHFCQKNLDKYDCPQRVVFLPKLPLNANGKVDVATLRKFVLEE